MNAYQDDQQGLSEGTIPQLDPGGIPRQTTQGFDAQIAIDQHPPVLLFGHCHHRDQLTVLLDRASQTVDHPGLVHPQGSKAQIQAVQIRFQGLDVKALHT